MNSLIVTVGLPGSFKTTKANKLVATNPTHFVNTNRDELRMMLFGTYDTWGDKEKESVVTRIQHTLIKDTLKRQKSPIVSDTNLIESRVINLIDIAKHYAVPVEFIYCPSTYNECLQHNFERSNNGGRWVEPSAILAMYKTMMANYGGLPNYDHLVNHIINNPTPFTYREGLPSAVIVDVDGTILTGDRDPYDYSLCHTDKPNPKVVAAVRRDYAAGLNIVIVTGRSADVYAETARSLELALGTFNFTLHMRRTDDKRSDAAVKNEIFNNHIQGRYNIEYVYDDRDQVVNMWRSKGLTVFQVNDGDF